MTGGPAPENRLVPQRPPADLDDVEAVERSIGAVLPRDYRAFLLAGDGAFLPDFNQVRGAPSLSLADLLPSRRSADYHILGTRSTYQGRVPPDFLVIGSDMAGNCWCLGIRGSHVGAMYWWDHELEVEEGAQPTMENMIFVAPTFADFISRIEPLDD